MKLFNSKIFAELYGGVNYKINDYPENPDGYCYIYFSGNGIFDPNTEASFYKTIVVNNRYEWTKWKAVNPAREIFIRDINKCWYYKGISSQYDCIEKTSELLRELTQDYAGRVITVGSSAGGYAAVLFGVMLDALRVFAFSAQFNIDTQLEQLDWINYIKNYRYSDIIPLVKNSTVPIYYFFPCLADWDSKQSQLIKNIDNVYAFPIKSKLHGKAVYANNMPTILAMNDNELNVLKVKFENKPTSPFVISVYLLGFMRSMTFFLINIIKPIYYRLNDIRRKWRAESLSRKNNQ
jgi:hypothetical protein